MGPGPGSGCGTSSLRPGRSPSVRREPASDPGRFTGTSTREALLEPASRRTVAADPSRYGTRGRPFDVVHRACPVHPDAALTWEPGIWPFSAPGVDAPGQSRSRRGSAGAPKYSGRVMLTRSTGMRSAPSHDGGRSSVRVAHQPGQRTPRTAVESPYRPSVRWTRMRPPRTRSCSRSPSWRRSTSMRSSRRAAERRPRVSQPVTQPLGRTSTRVPRILCGAAERPYKRDDRGVRAARRRGPCHGDGSHGRPSRAGWSAGQGTEPASRQGDPRTAWRPAAWWSRVGTMSLTVSKFRTYGPTNRPT